MREAEQNLRTAVERSFEVSEVREENSRLQAGLAQATEENRSLRSQLTEADAKAAAVDAVLDTTATSLRTAETALAKSRDSAAQIAAMQQENADLRRELDAALSKCETCERSERQHEMEGRSAKEEIATLRREAQDLSDQLRKSTAAEHEVNALRQRLGEAEQAGHDVSAVLDVTELSCSSCSCISHGRQIGSTALVARMAKVHYLQHRARDRRPKRCLCLALD